MAHVETHISDPHLTLQCKEQLENIQADAVNTITNIERLRNMLYRMCILTRQAGGVFISPTSITRDHTWNDSFCVNWETAHQCTCDTTKDQIYIRDVTVRLTDSNVPQILLKFFNGVKYESVKNDLTLSYLK